jgi:hypothetical protein
VNTKHHKISIGIAALITGALSLAPAIAVDAANRPSPDHNNKPNPALVLDAYRRPSPDLNKRPKPAALMACPAADDIPQCEIHRSADTAIGTSVTGATNDHPNYRPVDATDTRDGIDAPDFSCIVWEWHPFIFCPV